MKKTIGKIKLITASFLLISSLASCLSLGDDSADGGGFQSVPPSELQALTSIGITIHAYVVISIDPEKQHELTLNPETNNFQGEVKVQRDKNFDATVVYTADDPVTNQTLEIAHYIRRNLITTGEAMNVSYEGDEANWETLFDLSPGTPNAMNLDGDSYTNFVEIVYGSDSLKSESLPAGSKANATVKDELFGSLDVGLPAPGSDVVASLRGEEEITISATTPFDVKSIEIISPTFGHETTSYPETKLKGEKPVLQEKTMKIRLNTKRFVTGPKVGSMSLMIRVLDEFDIARETTLTFAAYNPTDDLAPYLLQWGLTVHPSVTDSTKFLLEIDDPSGIDNSSVQLRTTRSDVLVDSILLPSDEEPSATRFKSNINLDVSSFPDGDYTVTLSAKDFANNTLTETRTIQVKNTTAVLLRCGDGKKLGDEECDDGNQDNADSCTNSCRTTRCRDGILGPGEQCDDGNSTNGDGCNDVCQKESPKITVISPAHRSIVKGTITIEAEATSAWGIRSLIVSSPTLPDQDTRPSVFRTNWQTGPLLGGDYQLMFVTEDTDGRRAEETIMVSVNHDPTLSSFSATPVETPVNNSSDAIFSWSATDPDGDPLSFSVGIYEGPGCSGSPVRTETSTANSITSNLDPRADYSAKVTVTDGRGGVATGDCEDFTTRDEGLVGWWRMNEGGTATTTADTSGNDHDMTLQQGGSPDLPAWDSGILDDAIEFDGVGNHLQTDSVDLGFGNEWTVSFWVYNESVPGLMTFFSIGDERAINQNYLMARTYRGYIEVMYRGENATELAFRTPINLLTNNRWQHITISYNGGTDSSAFRIYLDGAEQQLLSDSPITTVPAQATSSSRRLMLGRDLDRAHDGCGAPPNGGRECDLKGRLDEFAIYNTALSIDRVREECRYSDSGLTYCPDPRTPIILYPKPGQLLPPTRAFWSWRGERGRSGALLYPGMEYEVKFDLDFDNNGSFEFPNIPVIDSEIVLTGNTHAYVESRSDYILSDKKYRIHVAPGEGPESTRLFSTDNSVAAWWKFDDPSDLGNDSANPYDGILSGLPGLDWINAGIDGSLRSEGNDDYINLSSHLPTLGSGSTDDFTIEARFRTNALTDEQVLFSFLDLTGPAPGIGLQLNNNGQVEAYVHDNRGSGPIIDLLSTDPVTTEEFYQAIMAYNGAAAGSDSSLRLIVNGESQASGTNRFDFPYSAFEFAVIGADISNGSVTNVFNGLIDEIVLYSGVTFSLETARNSYCATEALAGTDPLPTVCSQ